MVVRAQVRRVPFLVLATLLAGCSPASGPPADAGATAAAPATDAAAIGRELAMYRTLLAQGQVELAAPIGQEIVAKYPDSPAAVEVHKTLADVVTRAGAATAARRMKRLWAYQSGTESGGQQVTASIYSSRPAGADRVRLVLRRHSDWGQSAYLYAGGGGFACAGRCTLEMHFDDAPVRKFRAYLPPTGEPALFIEDDRGFIAAMRKATHLGIDATLKDKGAVSLEFDVGGYDPARFPEPGKQGARGSRG
jgi:hypothetical protein